MLERTLFTTYFGGLRGGKLEVTYWDGTSETLGKDGQVMGKITLHDPSALKDIVTRMDLGFAEAYMDGRLDVKGDLHDIVLLSVINRTNLPKGFQGGLGKHFLRGFKKSTSVKDQKTFIHHHYDLGNDFFKLFLDPTMTYSCAYYTSPQDSLEKAQKNKVDHTLAKLNLQKSDTLLDIGSGWGAMILRAAEKYGAKAHGITMSEEQVTETTHRIKEQKVESHVSVELTDYRDHAKTRVKAGKLYDKIVSVGMYEHVGRANLGLYLQSLSDMLTPGGVALLHYISQPTEQPGGEFTTKYIFPGGYIPSLRETISLMADQGFRILDVENLRLHYAYTLDAWSENYEKNLDKVREIFADRARLGGRGWGVDQAEQFIRMWRLYLRGASAAFRGGSLDLHQILVSKGINNDLPLTRVA